MPKKIYKNNIKPLPAIPEENSGLKVDITQTPKQANNEKISEGVDMKGEEQINKEPEGEFFGGMSIVPLTEGNEAEELEKLMSEFEYLDSSNNKMEAFTEAKSPNKAEVNYKSLSPRIDKKDTPKSADKKKGLSP